MCLTKGKSNFNALGLLVHTTLEELTSFLLKGTQPPSLLTKRMLNAKEAALQLPVMLSVGNHLQYKNVLSHGNQFNSVGILFDIQSKESTFLKDKGFMGV